MKIMEIISSIISPITKLIDDVHTSEEEKLELKAKMFEVQARMTMQVMEYEQQLLKSKADIVTAEAQGASFLQRNWRPITMLTFLVLVVCDSFGLLAFRLADEAWSLLQIGLGGYVIGRSVEKIAPKLKDLRDKGN